MLEIKKITGGNIMSIRDTVLEILRRIKPTVNLENVTDIIDGGYLDSLGIMALISELSEKYGFAIDIDWITPENFNSVDSIVSLVNKLKA